MQFHPCIIRVIEKGYNKSLVETHLEEPERMKICNILEVGQEFLVSSPFEMPQGICHSAWADIRPFILTMATGGRFEFMKDPNVAMAICSDPLRPVVFQIERLSK